MDDETPATTPAARTLVLGLARGTIALAVVASLIVRADAGWAVMLAIASLTTLGLMIYWRRRTHVVPARHIEPTLATIATGISLAVVLTLAVVGLSGPLGLAFIAVLLVAEWSFIRPFMDPPEDDGRSSAV